MSEAPIVFFDEDEDGISTRTEDMLEPVEETE